jgi:hypothetical protein
MAKVLLGNLYIKKNITYAMSGVRASARIIKAAGLIFGAPLPSSSAKILVLREKLRDKRQRFPGIISQE